MGQLLPTSWESLVAAKSFISRSEVCREGTIVRHELLRPRQVSRTSRLLSQARSVSPAEQYMRAWSKLLAVCSVKLAFLVRYVIRWLALVVVATAPVRTHPGQDSSRPSMASRSTENGHG